MSVKVAKKAKMITYSSYPIGWNKLKGLGWLKIKKKMEEEFSACKYKSCS